jgi:hypothetical protein
MSVVTGSTQDQASKVVQEAQIEVDRLIAMLASDGPTGDTKGNTKGAKGNTKDAKDSMKDTKGARASEHAVHVLWPDGAFESIELGNTKDNTKDTKDTKGTEDTEVPEGDEPRLASSATSFVHLIISSKRALTRKYGRLGFEQLDSDLRDLKQAIEAGSRRSSGVLHSASVPQSGSIRHSYVDLEVILAYVDDEASMARFGLQPVDPTNPWRVKKLVDSLDARLAEQGGEVRYLLIVGGDGIIPFHRLPNPVDDQDSDVPSDNPYASRDANYLIPERAVGRMPDGETEGAGFLHNLIRTAAEAHHQYAAAAPDGPLSVASKGLLSALSAVLDRIRQPERNGRELGYSASIWRKASRAVFRVIADNVDVQLRTCPPLTYEGFQVVEPPHLSYFNLHGIEDGSNWYGQRDTLFPADYPLFPLALRPQDPGISEHANAVVFTEACYGANILGKREDDSIALRLMGVGALAVVGSTKISYGSIAPPLLGADLVGKHFWEGLLVGSRRHSQGAEDAPMTVGEALRHAKVSLASEMQEREGYLDDEDQKALISFVLYGDPSLPITSLHMVGTVSASSARLRSPIICSDRASAYLDADTPGVGIPSGQKGLPVRPASRVDTVTDELVTRVKARIETSLPHMSHARVRARPLTVCTVVCENGECHLFDEDGHRSNDTFDVPSTLVQKGLSRKGVGWALTLQKDISIREHEGGDAIPHAHHQVVKVVVDESGHILKMAVSK